MGDRLETPGAVDFKFFMLSIFRFISIAGVEPISEKKPSRKNRILYTQHLLYKIFLRADARLVLLISLVSPLTPLKRNRIS